jgi:prepilin-type N-terminal cleavage/methylation domain-containing protein
MAFTLRAASRSRGFTLTELITTLIVLSILAAFVVARLDSVNVVGQRTELDEVFSAIAYARRAAVSARRYVCVAATSATVTFTVDSNPPESTSPPFTGSCPFATPLPLAVPSKNCTATNQVCLSKTSLSPASTFQFDPLGRASTTVTLTVSGFPSFRVEADTGYVH